MAALFAWVLLAEPLAALQGVGGVVVLLGIYLARRGFIVLSLPLTDADLERFHAAVESFLTRFGEGLPR